MYRISSHIIGGGNVSGQDFTKVMDFGRPLKNYHTVVDATNDFYYMGGTLMSSGNPNSNRLHFQQLDFNGNVLNSVTYDVANHDERCVAFVDFPYSGNKILVGLLRENATLPPTPKERIKILEVKNNGAIAKDFVIESVGSNTYNQIYPMDALVNDKYLYICGFVTDVTGLGQPNFFLTPPPPGNNGKEAFVLKFDMDLGTIVQFASYDFTPVPSNADFDMAMRIKIINVAGVNQLFVTGSCNVQDANTPFAIGSGTMSLIVDLNSLSIISSKPLYSSVSNSIWGVSMEYGFDIQPNPSGSGFFIFGNAGAAEQYYTNGFGAFPYFTWIHYVDLSFTPDIPNSRVRISQWDNLWGVHTLPSVQGGNDI